MLPDLGKDEECLVLIDDGDDVVVGAAAAAVAALLNCLCVSAHLEHSHSCVPSMSGTRDTDVCCLQWEQDIDADPEVFSSEDVCLCMLLLRAEEAARAREGDDDDNVDGEDDACVPPIDVDRAS